MGLAVLERAAKMILGLPDAKLRRSHARALRDSLKVTPGDVPPSVPSAQTISDDFSIDIPSLVDTLVCLDRAAAVAFLHDLKKPMTLDTFSKRYTARKYRDCFRRHPPVSGKKHVYTYGEVLHLLGYEQELTFPPTLRKYLD